MENFDLGFDVLGMLGLDDNAKKRRVGIEVEHQKKEEIKEILPEAYKILGQISMQVEKGKIINKKMIEAKELNGKMFGYYMNLRNLTKQKEEDDNPYDKILGVKELKKEELNLNIKGDYKGLLMQSYSEDIYRRRKVYINILIFEEVAKPESFLDNLDLSGLDFSNNNKEIKKDDDEDFDLGDIGFGESVA